jgi:YidC/Oxa1 family membrane protein insertase
MVVFFTLFYVLRAITTWTPGHAPKYGLTVPVVLSARKASIFGVHLYDKLLLPHTPGMGLVPSIVAAITVVLSATTTFLTVRQSAKRGLMQTSVDPNNPMAQSQKFMQYIVPFFSLTGLYWQYGLVMYWVTTNLWTLGQQYFMFRNWEPIEPAMAGEAGSAVAVTSSSLRPSSGAPKPASRGGTRTSSGGTKTSSGGTRTGGSNGRTDTTAPRGPAAGGRTRPASRGPAATADTGTTGQNGAEKRGLLRLGRAKPEPEPEPEVPTAKVVRQQPTRQARSKRSGKR